MSRYFPHPEYAEDQPYSHSILTTHVLHRGFQTGAFLGSLGGLTYSTYRHFRPVATTTATTTTTTTTTATTSSTASSPGLFRKLFLPTTLRATGIGATAGLGLMAVGLVARMWGREEIEWQDRAWRLLENEGQMSTDDWSLGGMVVGAALAVLAARRGALGVVIKNRPMAVIGAAGLGSLAGTVGSMEWRALRRPSVRHDEKDARGPNKRLLEE